MMRRAVAVAGLLLFVGVRVAAAQDANLLVPSDREASAQIAAIVASMDAKGLPTDPIVGKVRYGVRVMRSSPPRLVQAAQTIATNLETARTALAPNPSSLEITAGADALGAKATTESLRAIRKAGGSRSVQTALGLLTSLLSSEVPLDSATKIVTDLVRRGATPQQLVAFVEFYNADMATGMTAVAAMDVRARLLVAVLAAPNGAAAAAAADAFTQSAVGSGVRSDPPKPRRP
jgi:hypothetical protein